MEGCLYRTWSQRQCSIRQQFAHAALSIINTVKSSKGRPSWCTLQQGADRHLNRTCYCRTEQQANTDKMGDWQLSRRSKWTSIASWAHRWRFPGPDHRRVAAIHPKDPSFEAFLWTTNNACSAFLLPRPLARGLSSTC